MVILIGLISVATFVQIYWLIPRHYQNYFLIAGSIVFGVAFYLHTLAIALILGSFVFLVLVREIKIPVALMTSICLFPLVVLKLFPSSLGEVSLLGLSYFTFILLGAFYDLRKRAERSALGAADFFCFILFFPIIPIGPIERFEGLGRQIRVPRQWRSSNLTTGVLLVALGVFKKVVIADRLNELAVDSEMNSLSYYGLRMWGFSFLALLQVFADFSSIVDIVRGLGKLLGFNLIDNFDRPYLADSIQDIWRRWHISLVSWLRDFVYTPIALRSRSVLISSAAVILMVGLWHEASWRFGLWSLYWISIFWAAVFMRQRGIRLNIGRLPKRISMVAVMAVSTIFMMPSSVSELTTLAGNFFRFTSSEFKPLNVSNANLLTALFGFSVVLGVDTIADKLMIRYRPHVESEQSVRSHVISLVIASIMLIISIALAAGTWEKFIYLRY
jgi:D-alanyl-lipoteichoic acid acyltransferase DltB (MBOAT superfamily)